jgi:hypothetical protein
MLRRIVGKLGGSVSKNVTHNTSHVVISGNKPASNGCIGKLGTGGERAKLCTRTQKYMMGVVHGKWVVDTSWLIASRDHDYWVDEHDYEVDGDTTTFANGASSAARHGRLRREKGRPRLLENWDCVLIGDFVKDVSGVDKRMLTELLGSMGTRDARETSAPKNRRRSRGGQSSSARLAAHTENRVVIIEQSLDQLSAQQHELFEQLAGASDRPWPAVHFSWIFDTISHFEPQAFDDYIIRPASPQY